jgi:hypothetical protein
MIKLVDIIRIGHAAIIGDVINAYRNSNGKYLYEANLPLDRQRYKIQDRIKTEVNGRGKSSYNVSCL